MHATEIVARANISRMMYDVNVETRKSANIGSDLILQADLVVGVPATGQPHLRNMGDHGFGGSRQIMGGDAFIEPGDDRG
jgi:hypothetical protein